MKITHSCGHGVDYIAVKDKKSLAARRCPACEFKAREAGATSEFWSVDPTGLVFSSKTVAAIMGRPDATREDEAAKGRTIFDVEADARAEGEKRRAELVARQEALESTPEWRERRAAMAAMGEADRLDAATAAERADAFRRTPEYRERLEALGEGSPDDEDADESLFGVH